MPGRGEGRDELLETAAAERLATWYQALALCAALYRQRRRGASDPREHRRRLGLLAVLERTGGIPLALRELAADQRADESRG